jgi:precorrin-2 dehydrogenase/sirohydrochlorin ferrochelatase
MLPVVLDPAVLPLAVAGRGVAARRRFLALRAGGAGDPLLFCDQPDEALARTAGDAQRRFLPGRADMASLRALWVAGLPDDRAADLAALARAERVLVNVEDRPELCDFHSVAEVRRGGLLLTVSTGGASPGLAARIRARLAAEYGPEWDERLAHLRRHRETWRHDGSTPAEVGALTDALLHANGWLT